MHTRRSAARGFGALIAWLGVASANAAGLAGGLTVPSEPPSWSTWQARLALQQAPAGWSSPFLGASSGGGLKVQRLSLMGDYYFASLPFGSRGAGGFRATSGLLQGRTSASLWNSPSHGDAISVEWQGGGWVPGENGTAQNAGTTPYLGLGYSGLTGRGGWGFAADVGLLVQRSAVRFGRNAAATDNVDQLLRDLRLTPVLQLGVSYAF